MASTEPEVSIILPVKNGMPYLKDCIDSITRQSFKDWELIAVNDHSSDGTVDLLRSVIDKEPRMRWTDSSMHGILPAMDLGFRLSRGKCITRMDADDVMKKDKLNIMRNHLLDIGPGHVVTGEIEYIASGKSLEGGYRRYQRWINDRCRKRDHFNHIYEECVLPSPNWMVFKKDLKRIKSFCDQRYPEDYELCFQFYKHGLDIHPVDEVLHQWRDHPARNTRTNPIYADPTYFEIKTDYFMSLERDHHRPLLLYGAGVKGKKLARIWVDRSIDFQWSCSTQSKWGHRIYGKTIRDPEDIAFDRVQTVIAISAPEGRETVDRQMRDRALKQMKDYLHFC